MFHGEIIRDTIEKRSSAKKIMDVLDRAIEMTSVCPYQRTFHFVQGWVYQMKIYSHTLREAKIFQSKSKKERVC